MRGDYPEIIGRYVRGKIDRPLGSRHPRHADTVYPVNYGYADDVLAEDGAKQDVYLLGADVPLREFGGYVIAVYRRFDDAEDKWIVSADRKDYSDAEILEKIDFQERFFRGELLR